MVKKVIVAIIAVVLVSAVLVGASHKWGYTRYGAVYYYGQPTFSYYPVYNYPYYGAYYPSTYYRYPAYAYPYYYNPLASENLYRYGLPETSYAYGGTSPYMTLPLARSGVGAPCGIIDSSQYGCEFGLVCDYTKGNAPGVGECSRQTATTTYPYQVDSTTPYYYG